MQTDGIKARGQHYKCYRSWTRLTMSQNSHFLGSLSLHVNHLKHHAWQLLINHLGHLLLEFLVKFALKKELKTYHYTHYGHFWNISVCYNSRVIWALFRKWVLSENQSLLNEGVIITHFQFSFRRAGIKAIS